VLVYHHTSSGAAVRSHVGLLAQTNDTLGACRSFLAIRCSLCLAHGRCCQSLSRRISRLVTACRTGSRCAPCCSNRARKPRNRVRHPPSAHQQRWIPVALMCDWITAANRSRVKRAGPALRFALQCVALTASAPRATMAAAVTTEMRVPTTSASETKTANRMRYVIALAGPTPITAACPSSAAPIRTVRVVCGAAPPRHSSARSPSSATSVTRRQTSALWTVTVVPLSTVRSILAAELGLVLPSSANANTVAASRERYSPA